MSADRRFTFRVPAFAARHRSAMVKHAIDLAKQAFSDRFNLRVPRRDRWGNVTREPLHMFLFRARPGGDELKGRRADHFQVQLALWVTMIAIADYETWALLEPDHERARNSPHPTMLRLAELADIVPPDHGLTDAPDCVWDARAEIEHAGILSFTKEWRVENEDGSHRTTGGALRRLGPEVLASMGGAFGRAVVDQYDETKRRRAQRAQEAAEFKARVDALWLEERRAEGAASSQTPQPVTSSPEDLEIDKVHAEQPGWSFSRVLAEARRRLRELARAPLPADDTS